MQNYPYLCNQKQNQSAKMKEQDTIFSEKAASYLVCFNEQCARHEQCLRWIVGQHVGGEQISRVSINPHNAQVKAGSCPVFRDARPVRVGIGMTGFYHDMPGWLEKSIKGALISRYSRTGYYRIQNGTRPVTPEMEEAIRTICQKNGWDTPLRFDSYKEDYLW